MHNARREIQPGDAAKGRAVYVVIAHKKQRVVQEVVRRQPELQLLLTFAELEVLKECEIAVEERRTLGR